MRGCTHLTATRERHTATKIATVSVTFDLRLWRRFARIMTCVGSNEQPSQMCNAMPGERESESREFDIDMLFPGGTRNTNADSERTATGPHRPGQQLQGSR
jgi:hypothetical protein